MTHLTFQKSYDEIDNIKTFVFEKDTAWQPGQFREYTLPAAGESEDDNRRWFTIASAPSENEIHITTRMSGSKFKNTLGTLQPGDTIEVKDPEGDFTWDTDDSIVMVAGGIGITPLRSMVVERKNTGRPMNAKLLYYGRDENFAFRELFDQLASEHDEFSVEYIVGEAVSADSIFEHAPEARDKTVCLTGAEPMVESVGEILKGRGVSLKQDWLPGYDDKTY